MFTFRTVGIVALFSALLALAPNRPDLAAAEPDAFPFKDGDRVAWVGSSSTKIGVWPKTIQFLLATRHPELKLEYRIQSTGGGAFAKGIEKLVVWLDSFKPTLVFFNYGGNDANPGASGIPKFKDNIEKCVAKVQDHQARFIFSTHQAADARKSKEEPAEKRRLYAETILAFAKEKQWRIVDVFHPLDRMQQEAQKEDDSYSMLKDTVHLTDSGYVAWAYFLYEGLNPPAVASAAELTAKGEVTKTTRCKINDAKVVEEGLSFTRNDEVLPILPPVAPPPRKWVPLEKFSDYKLTITGLSQGKYAILVEGKPIGEADAASLGKGMNLNSLLLDSKNPAPWEELAKQIYAGKNLDQIGKTSWKFEVKRVRGNP